MNNIHVNKDVAIRRLYFSQKRSIDWIAKAWEMSELEIENIINNKNMNEIKETKQERYARIRKLKAQGYSNKKIKEVVGCGQSTIYRACSNKKRKSQSRANQQGVKSVTVNQQVVSNKEPVVVSKKHVSNKTVEFNILWGLIRFSKSSR